jgi:hypothetical protein
LTQHHDKVPQRAEFRATYRVDEQSRRDYFFTGSG